MHAETVFADLALGDGVLCGVRQADSVVVCAGTDARGQLGDGTGDSTSYRLVETQTPLRARSISGAGASFCAIDASNDAYCWGANDTSQLGPAFSGDTVWAPSNIVEFLPGFWFGIAAGSGHTCGLTNKNMIPLLGNGELR